jgi:hypothetical protein
LPDWLIPKSAAIRRGHDAASAVIELVKSWPDCAGCTGKAGHFHQFCRRDVSLRDKQMPNDRIIRRKPSGSLW